MSSFQPKPLVTVVIPCYNGQDVILDAIESVFSQTYLQWELIVVDDGSTDETPLLLQKKQSMGAQFSIITGPNFGTCHARNMAINAAETEYVAFLDADDVWHPDKLRKQIDFITANTRLIGVTTTFHLMDVGKTKIRNGQSFEWMPKELWTWALLGGTSPALCSTLLVKASALREIGGFDESLVSHAEDLDLSWRLASLGELARLPEDLATIRMSDSQSHRNLPGVIHSQGIFLEKIAAESPELSRVGKLHLKAYEALRPVLTEKSLRAVGRLCMFAVQSPLTLLRFLLFRLSLSVSHCIRYVSNHIKKHLRSSFR